jgi:hypothetical protein
MEYTDRKCIIREYTDLEWTVRMYTDLDSGLENTDREVQPCSMLTGSPPMQSTVHSQEQILSTVTDSTTA